MSHKRYVCAPPPIESLLEESTGQSFWPKRLISNYDFSRQITFQQNILRRVRQIFAQLPLTTSVADGLTQGLILETEVIDFYSLLTIQLEGDEVQKRLSLYLPFELLTPITDGSPLVQEASARFQAAYRLAWEQQLTQHEVRANYVDGDVLEPELRDGDHPRVVKAAHLIPGLLNVGHLSIEDVLRYKQQSTDALLIRSIEDACMVASDIGLLKPQPVTYTNDTTPQVSIGMTEGRAKWLASVADAHAMQKKTEIIALALEQGQHVSSLLSDQELVCAIEAIRIATLQDLMVFVRHRAWLAKVNERKFEPGVQDSFIKLIAHLHAKGVLGDEDLKQWNVTIPELNGPFYPNHLRLDPTATEILDMCMHVAAHPRLTQLLYPVTLVFGSRIKGYGTSEADCDIAVFVRPGVDRNERHYIEETLLEIYTHKNFNSKVTLFWLTDAGEHLQVIDWPHLAPSDGWSSWVYILFGALWCGEQEQCRMLHARLLSSYFTAPNTLIDDRPTYVRWLEEVERDSLQYRLLHKGFERYFPIQSPMNTTHGNVIDGQSAFYDPRYRRIATELFIRRVFLPQKKCTKI